MHLNRDFCSASFGGRVLSKAGVYSGIYGMFFLSSGPHWWFVHILMIITRNLLCFRLLMPQSALLPCRQPLLYWSSILLCLDTISKLNISWTVEHKLKSRQLRLHGHVARLPAEDPAHRIFYCRDPRGWTMPRGAHTLHGYVSWRPIWRIRTWRA